MSLEYAQKQNLILKNNITKIFKIMQPFFPFPTAANSKSLITNLDRLFKYVKCVKHIYLYGTGDVGRFCLAFLRKNGINPVYFLVSGNVEEENVDCLPVKSLKDIEFQCDIGVVITVVRKEIQDTMIHSLKKNNCGNYFVFWK